MTTTRGGRAAAGARQGPTARVTAAPPGSLTPPHATTPSTPPPTRRRGSTHPPAVTMGCLAAPAAACRSAGDWQQRLPRLAIVGMIPLRGGGGGCGTTTSRCCGWRGGALGNGLPIPGRDLVAASDAAVGWMEQRHAWGGRGVVQGLTAGIGKAVTHHRTPHTPTMPPPRVTPSITPVTWGGGGRRLARYRRVMVSGRSKRRCRRHLLSSATDARSTRVCPGGLCVCALSLLFARREGVEGAAARLEGRGRACGGGRKGHGVLK